MLNEADGRYSTGGFLRINGRNREESATEAQSTQARYEHHHEQELFDETYGYIRRCY